MGRRSRRRVLNVWANGQLVGHWRIPPAGQMEFQYAASWLESPQARPLSLSLPLSLDNLPLKGEAVGHYFDNLLPDSEPIRKRLQNRFRTASREPFELLAAIGRDCVGAIQLLPEESPPEGVFAIQTEPLTEEAIERILLQTTASPAPNALEEDEALRISIAGAQEKTAFTWHEGQWCRPLHATPTTHIFKLPLGLIGNRQADMRTSIENEWLCAQICSAYGIPVAQSRLAQFGESKVLIVTRFDRQLHSSGKYWLRLPQEDFCQATATPAAAKYEADGGPGITRIAQILQGSETRNDDLATLLRAQLLFWLLAAIDGHAKNFSLRLLFGGRYRLTPLYDILSAWPIVGKAANQFDKNKLKLAMAVHGKNTHYKLGEIQRRHFNATARRCGLGNDMEPIIADILERTPAVVEQLGMKLPPGFPMDVFESVTLGLRQSTQKLARMPAE